MTNQEYYEKLVSDSMFLQTLHEEINANDLNREIIIMMYNYAIRNNLDCAIALNFALSIIERIRERK